MHKFWAWLGLNLGKHAGIVSIVGLLLTITLGYGITKLDFATGQDSYLNKSEDVYKNSVSYQELFGGQAMVTLVTLGPITSLALVLRSNPGLVREKVARHVAMIGNIEAPGNQTRFSEFNAWCDPEALDRVLRAELPTELVGLDVTRRIVVTAAEVDALADAGPEARWLHDALRCYVEFHRQYEQLDGCVVNDVLPIAALIDPAVLTWAPLRVAVGLVDGDGRGRTVVDPEGPRVRVATAVRPELVRDLLFARVLSPAAHRAEVAT